MHVFVRRFTIARLNSLNKSQSGFPGNLGERLTCHAHTEKKWILASARMTE
jgi:hypothetical protein